MIHQHDPFISIYIKFIYKAKPVNYLQRKKVIMSEGASNFPHGFTNLHNIRISAEDLWKLDAPLWIFIFNLWTPVPEEEQWRPGAAENFLSKKLSILSGSSAFSSVFSMSKSSVVAKGPKVT